MKTTMKLALAALATLAQASLMAAPTLRIMPVGDSITEGACGTKAGYRYFLYRDLVADGYAVDYVGDTQVNSYAELPDSDHSGHSGWYLGSTGGFASIQAYIGAWLDALAQTGNLPDVILLHAGTNDASRREPLTDLPDALRSVLATIKTKAPNAHVVVTTVLERNDVSNWTGDINWDRNINDNYNAYVPTVVAEAADGGQKVHFLDMRSKLTQPGDFDADLLHPNDSGYLKMSDAWRAEIERIFGPRAWTASDAESERACYSLVYEFTPVDNLNAENPGAVYSVNNAESFAGTTFDRVGYYVELQKSGETKQTLWVSFDAHTNDLSKIGIPYDYAFDGTVDRMNVYSNVEGVDNLALITRGRLEFWDDGFSDGGDGLFDCRDVVNDSIKFGTMQIHDLSAGTSGKTVFSYSAWMHPGYQASLGIGTCPLAQRKNSDPDWSFAQNIAEFEVKTVKVYAHLATDSALPVLPEAPEPEDDSGEGGGDAPDPETIVDSVGLLLVDYNTQLTEVEAGHKLKVDAITTEKNAIVKDGDGILEFGYLAGMGNAADYNQQAGLYGLDFQPTPPSISVWNGSVAIGAPVAIDQTARTTTPVMHFDASATDTLTTETDGSDTRVTQWRDPVSGLTANGKIEYTFDDGTKQTMPIPYLRTGALNGLPVVDFGKFVEAQNGQRPDGQWWAIRDYDLSQSGMLHFNDTAVREIFMVVRTKERRNQPFYLGSTYGWVYSFSPGAYGTLGFPQCGQLNNGETRVDGVKVRHDQYVPDQEFHVVALSATGSIGGLNTFTQDRHCRIGGMELGEIIAYNQELSVEERRAVEAYLMEKWFSKQHPVQAPAMIGTLSFGSGADPVLVAERPTTVEYVSASGTFTKSGSADVVLHGFAESIDHLAVTEGKLSVTSAGNPLDAMDDAFFHIDPSDATTLTKDGDNVTRIDDVRAGAGVYASNSDKSTAKGPTLVKSTTNLDLLDFGTFAYNVASSSGDTCGMLWSERKQIYTICAVVEKKEEHDSFLVGDSSDQYNFHADNGYIIHSGYAAASVRPSVTETTVWTLDGNVINPETTAWPSGLHVITCTIQDKRADGVPLAGAWAGAFAQDRADPCRIGGMRYGEVVVFTNTISQTQVKAIGAYLKEKWLGAAKDTSNGLHGLSVAARSRLSLAGDVTIADDALVSIGFAKGGQSGRVEIGGEVLLGKNVAVTVGEDPKGSIAIVSAESFAGAEAALSTWTLNGGRPKFRIADGILYAECGNEGFIVIVR